MKPPRRIVILLALALALMAGVIWFARPLTEVKPVDVRFQGFQTNSVGLVAVFTATNVSSHYWILELSTERLVNGIWTAEPWGGSSGFGIVADHQQWRIHELVPAGPETRRGVVDCIRIPRNKLLREIDILLGTYLGKADVKVRCYSDAFHVPQVLTNRATETRDAR